MMCVFSFLVDGSYNECREKEGIDRWTYFSVY